MAMPSSDLKGRFSRSVLWVVWGKTGIQILSLCSTLFIARILDPGDFGVMALAGIWTAIVIALSEMGLGAAIIQFQDVTKQELNVCFWLTLFVSVICYAALYALAPSLGIWFENPRLPPVLRVLGLVFPLVALGIVPESLLRKRLLLNYVSQAEMIAAVSSMPVMVGLAIQGAGVWALVAGSLLRPLVQSTLVFWYQPWIPGIQFQTDRFKDIFAFSFHSLGSNFLWVTFAQIDIFLLGRMANESLLGFYSMAKDLALLPVSKIGVVVNQISRPLLALFQKDVDKMQSSFLHGLRLVNLMILPVCVGLALVGEQVVTIGLGEKWLPCVPIMQVLCFYGVIRSFNLFLPHVLSARYRAQFLFHYSLMRLVVMFVALLVGTKLISEILGVSAGLSMGISWVCFYPIVSGVIVRRTMFELNLSLWELFRELVPAIRATLCMVGVGLLCNLGLNYFGPWQESDWQFSFIWLVAEVMICGLVYLGTLIVGSPNGVNDLVRILQLVGGEKKTKMVTPYLTKLNKYVIQD